MQLLLLGDSPAKQNKLHLQSVLRGRPGEAGGRAGSEQNRESGA